MDSNGEARVPSAGGSAGNGGEGHHHDAASSTPLPSPGVYAGAASSYPAHPHHNSFLYASNGEFPGLHSQYQPADLYTTSELGWNTQSHHLQAQPFPQDAFRPFNGDHSSYAQHLHAQPTQSFANQFGSNPQGSTIAPSQLGDDAYLQPPQQPLPQPQQHSTISPAQVWNDFSSQQPSQQPAQTAPHNQHSANAPAENVAVPNKLADGSAEYHPNASNDASKVVEGPFEGLKLQGCPWVTLVDGSQMSREFLDAISKNGFLSDDPVPSVVAKKAKTSTTTSSPRNSPAPMAARKLPAPPEATVPTEPISKLKYEIEECLDCDDDYDDVRDSVNRLWHVLSEVQPTQTDMVACAVKTILKGGDEEMLSYIGRVQQFAVRVRKWVVHEFNTNKRSVMVYNMLRLFSKLRVPLETYEHTQWGKVLKKVDEKAEFQKSRDIAAEIMRWYERLANERSKKQLPAPTDGPKKPTAPNGAASTTVVRANGEKVKPVENGGVKKEAGSNLSVGMKRKSEDEIRPAAAASAAKRVAVDARLPVISSKPVASAAGPAKNGTNAIGDKKPTKTVGISTAPPATATDPSKAKTSSFFKPLGAKGTETAKSQTKPAPKPSAPLPTSTSGFTSIFDQLRLKQKQDQDREKALASKGNESDSKKSDDEKKKKKTVRWKTGDELTKVQVIEWIEPEGEYYGGGGGMDHDWGSARSFDVEEGKEAMLALKNRNFLDEDEDFVDWSDPAPIDFSEMHEKNPNVVGHSQRRGGNEVIETEESKARATAELTTLAAFYTSAREIPDSPKEPDADNDGSKEPEKEPMDIPLPDNLKQWGATQPAQQAMLPQANDLSSLLSSFQQPNPQQPTADPQAASNIFAHLQASLGLAQPQAAPQAPAAPQAAPQLDLTSLLSAVAQFNPAVQQQNPQQPQGQQVQQANFLQNFMQQTQQHQQQAGQPPNNQVTDLLARLTGGMQPGSSAGFIPNLLGTAGAQMTGMPGMPGWPGFDQQGQQNQSSFATQGQDAQQQGENRSGRDIRRELREQAGWSDKEQPLPPPVSDASSGAGSGRGKNWEKKHKKSKAEKKAKQQQQNQQQGNPNTPCIFFQKGTCRHGDSCRFSHSIPGKRKHGGRGVEAGLGAGAATGGWPTPGEMEY